MPRMQQYIPDDGSMGLPKAYGCHAPFLPSEVGGNMRYIRRPKERELC